ncbi:hypothetical protein J416_00789 [Gracilibacillus halophilus YIM-C55.5]|uniref:Magnesium transporter MgtE intracellular domain-containing protein n=1 Tax=Gracilibacillus halophilus YIM-C55.5 TaxID=1308866 RepID=N4WQ26_9BACI|nr:hypothetical protein [Gracilibacillus halophilus]ENH98237.1 hypothetical protein J416_00789 [Gracilibacillus halophilus YIM-C55.5]
MASNSEKKPGIFQWIIVIIVPLIFALVLTFVVLQFMGIDVVSKSKDVLNQVPFISEKITTDEEASQQSELEEKDSTIEEKNNQISNLESQIAEKDSQIEQLQSEVEELSTQLSEMEAENSEESGPSTESVEEYVTSFEAMDPETAAPIIENMENQLALATLQSMGSEVRGEILAAMESETAATFADQLLNQE